MPLVLLPAGCAQAGPAEAAVGPRDGEAGAPAPSSGSGASGSSGSSGSSGHVVRLPEESLPFIEVQEVSSQSQAAVLRVPARVAFRDGAVSRLSAPLWGRVQEVHVRTGDRVAAGDPLVTLDCPEAASIRAALASSRAAQRELRAALDRQLRMGEQGVGTERERLLAERALAEAEAELARAQAAARFVGAGEGSTLVLRAPIAGAVVSRTATVGAAVQPGDVPLVEVGNPAQLWVIADVFETDLHLLDEGARAHVELPSVPQPLSGLVVSIGVVVDGAARTAPVRIALDVGHQLLRPGMFGRARIEAPAEALSVPTQAVLLREGRETVVYVQVDHGAFARRAISTTRPVDGRVLVTSGLVPGEPVVVRGALLLDGAADQLL